MGGVTSRRNASFIKGHKSDKVDARQQADLLRTGRLRPVYHGENGLRTARVGAGIGASADIWYGLWCLKNGEVEINSARFPRDR